MSIFPFIDSSTTAEESEDLPMLKEYAYDYEKNELLLDQHGKTYMRWSGLSAQASRIN